MLLSLFLAKIMGLYLLIAAGLWVVKKEQVDESIEDFASSRGLVLFSGAISLIAGLAIAIGHPIWEFNWRGLITAMGYLFILQGIMRFAFVDQVQRGVRTLPPKGTGQ